jgi:tetratricopeptide (TPR) repeat protein
MARSRLEQQRAQAELDVAEVQSQVEAGEMDRATAEELIARYRHEIAQTSLQIAAVDSQGDGAQADGPDPVSRRRRRIGAGLLIGTFVVAGVLAAQAIQPRQEGQFVTGGPVNEGSGGLDLDTVTNDQMEAVISANADLPEVAQMRVALANRYFEEGEFSAALSHYIEAADGELRPDQRAQSLGRIGWMTYLSGRTDLAEDYLGQALSIDPGYAEGTFFLGLLELYGNNDPAAALPLLEQIAARDDLPDDIREQVDAAITDAAAALGNSGAAP